MSDIKYKTQNQEGEVQKTPSLHPHPLGLLDEKHLPKVVVGAAAAAASLLLLPLLLLLLLLLPPQK